METNSLNNSSSITAHYNRSHGEKQRVYLDNYSMTFENTVRLLLKLKVTVVETWKQGRGHFIRDTCSVLVPPPLASQLSEK